MLARFLRNNAIDFDQGVSFKKMTTLGVGGVAAVVAYPDTTAKLCLLADELSKQNEKFIVLGGGSNVVAPDGYFSGVVVSTKKCRNVWAESSVLVAECGASCASVATFAVKNAMGGAEFLACIPGTIGGAARGNAGCFGADFSSVCKAVVVYADGKIKRLEKESCCFANRNSNLKDCLVLSCELDLPQSDGKSADIIAEMQAKKRLSQPLDKKSAGCVFKNGATAAAKLIDSAALKGYVIGGARVSEKHAGFIVNDGDATAKDVRLLVDFVKERVAFLFGEQLEEEIVFL